MIELKLKLSKELEKHLAYLETISKRPKDFIVKEALIQYLENAEDVAKYYEEEKTKGGKTYTTEELLEHLNLKEIKLNKTHQARGKVSDRKPARRRKPAERV